MSHHRSRSDGRERDYKSKYEKNHSSTELPVVGEKLDDYMRKVGFRLERGYVEGFSREVHKNHFSELLRSNQWITKVCEIGFNLGHSAVIFLDEIKERKDSLLVSFDILQHNYVHFAKMFMDVNYPNKHILIGGDSAKTVPTFQTFFPTKFDLIFIDGDHSEKGAYNDILNMKEFAHKNTIVIIDNVAPHCGFGIGVYNAFKRAVEENLLAFDKHIEIDDYRDAFVFCRYLFKKRENPFNDHQLPARKMMKIENNNLNEEGGDECVHNQNQSEENNDIDSNQNNNNNNDDDDDDEGDHEFNKPDYEKITRRVEITELCKKLRNVRTPNELREIKTRITELDNEGKDKVDQWARDELDKIERRFKYYDEHYL